MLLYKLNLQVCNYAQKRRICRKNSEYAPDENSYAHFCSRRKADNFCQPELALRFLSSFSQNRQNISFATSFGHYRVEFWSRSIQLLVQFRNEIKTNSQSQYRLSQILWNSSCGWLVGIFSFGQ